MFPYPIPAYPTNPPPKWPGATVADCTFTMPEWLAKDKGFI